MKNKLSYLGFLGLLGFAGFWGTPWLFALFANFVFFQYIKVVPDELFWANVRISATRAFFIYMFLANIVLVAALVILETDTLYSYSPVIMIGGFVLTMVISEYYFIHCLSRLEKKELQGKDDGEGD